MNYHPGTTEIKSRGNAFDIPPRSTNIADHIAPPRRGPKKKTKAQESASALRTDEERTADRIAARTDKATAFRAPYSHNFAQNPVASKTVKVASGRFASV